MYCAGTLEGVEAHIIENAEAKGLSVEPPFMLDNILTK